MTFLQEQLQKFNEVTAKVDNRLKTVNNLLKLGTFVRQKSGNLQALDMEIKPEYSDEDCTLTMAYAVRAGDKYPRHIHELSHQYLVCVKGSFAVEIFDYKTIVRIVDAGQCVSIEKGHEHAMTALEDDSKMASVCVPIEPAYIKK